MYVCLDRDGWVCAHENVEVQGLSKRISDPIELEFQVAVSCQLWMLRMGLRPSPKAAQDMFLTLSLLSSLQDII